MPCADALIPLTFETLTTDGLTGLLMARDGVSAEEMRALLERVSERRGLVAAVAEPRPAA